MKCLNCGCENTNYICNNCRTPEVLERIFNDIIFYNKEKCTNSYLSEFASRLTEKGAERKIIPEILGYFEYEVADYFYCQYYDKVHSDLFEKTALQYIEMHDMIEIRTQRVIYNLLNYYIPNDFIKPLKWCEIIENTDNFCVELYGIVAKFYAMIGEYDKADNIVEKALRFCGVAGQDKYIFSNREKMTAQFEKQKNDTERYRTQKPYWPKTEERRRAVAMFYNEKGIKYPRIETKPVKIKENEFAPIKVCYEDMIDSYCAFWCSEVFSITAAKDIYEIAAVKVRDGKIIESFESLIRPWDGSNSRKYAAKEAGVTLEVIENTDEVDLVIPRFFNFVGEDVLVCTGAFGNQAKLLSRAARYSGIREIKNEFFEILDFAADKSKNFDFDNNTREYLLSYFKLNEGVTALEKAKINFELYEKLINYGD